MKLLSLAAALTAFAAFPALADPDDITRLLSNADVTATADRLAAGIEAAGAKLMARVDHGAGAQAVGSDIGASQLLIFGNPKLGTPVMEQNRLAGLMLPLHVLVYEDAQGQTWIAYENIDERLDDLDGIQSGDETVQPLKGALTKLTTAAAGG